MNRPVLTPARLDAMLEGKQLERNPLQLTRSSLATESLWGALAIANFMGVSDDYVRKLAKAKEIDPRCPIRQRGGRYYATKTEIVAWLISDSEMTSAASNR